MKVVANFLDLHIVDYCQLNCKHCYLNQGHTFMPVDILKEICIDFLQTDFPLPQSTIILSGGEPLLHPHFDTVCNIVRGLNGFIALSSNGILIPQHIDLFQKDDGIQISIDGDKTVHDFIRGTGSYEKAVNALKILDENRIRHSISSSNVFTLALSQTTRQEKSGTRGNSLPHDLCGKGLYCRDTGTLCSS